MDLALLRAERMKRGITQEKLAKCLGFKDKSSYCLMEKGKTSISVEVQETSTDTILTHGGDVENGKCDS